MFEPPVNFFSFAQFFEFFLADGGYLVNAVAFRRQIYKTHFLEFGKQSIDVFFFVFHGFRQRTIEIIFQGLFLYGAATIEDLKKFVFVISHSIPEIIGVVVSKKDKEAQRDEGL